MKQIMILFYSHPVLNNTLASLLHLQLPLTFSHIKISPITLVNTIKLKMHQQTVLKSQTLKSICGPFDLQFKRKFLGHRSSSLSSIRNKLLKSPSLEPKQLVQSNNLLPRIKELQKISKNGSKNMGKQTKKEQISELQLYLAKKLINTHSIKDFIAKVQTHQNHAHHNLSDNPLENATKLTSFSQTQSKFYNPNSQILGNKEDIRLIGSKTTYSPSKKWISDDQFKQKFDDFISKRPQQEQRVNELFVSDKGGMCESMIEQIEHNKRDLKAIVKKMIDEQYYQSDTEDYQQPIVKAKTKKSEEQTTTKNIHWILNKCEDYQRKFKVRKSVVKPKK